MATNFLTLFPQGGVGYVCGCSDKRNKGVTFWQSSFFVLQHSLLRPGHCCATSPCHMESLPIDAVIQSLLDFHLTAGISYLPHEWAILDASPGWPSDDTSPGHISYVRSQGETPSEAPTIHKTMRNNNRLLDFDMVCCGAKTTDNWNGRWHGETISSPKLYLPCCTSSF